MKRALITGITWQDGLYLAALLLGNGYQVHHLSRGRVSCMHEEPRNNSRGTRRSTA